MNKYEQKPEYVVDLHGYTTYESEEVLADLFEQQYSHVRIIIGKGTHSTHGSVLRDFVKGYLHKRNIRFCQSKIQDGGEGALEVFS